MRSTYEVINKSIIKMINFRKKNQTNDLLDENCDFLARHFKEGIDVYCVFALEAALVGEESSLYCALEQVSEPFKRDAHLLSAFYAAKHNHPHLVLNLLKKVAPQEHWDIAATAFCYGHTALAENIVAQKPMDEEDEILLDSLVPRGLNKFHRYSR